MSLEKLKNVLHVTKSLEKLLNQKITPNNREQIVSQINDLVEKRGKLLQQITPPFSIEEQQLGKKVLELNNFIQKQMDHLFTELKEEMKQINRRKKSNQSYENPYKSIQSVDGMFLDQKK